MVIVPRTILAKKSLKSENQAHKDRICGIDPGIRVFNTVYSDNVIAEIGKFSQSKLEKQYIKTKHLQEIYNRTKNNKLRYKLLCNQLKLKNQVKHLHYVTANWLVRNFDCIVLGKLGTSRIVQGKLHPRTKDKAHILSHYTFQQKIKNKAETEGKRLILLNEAYTSKTCTKCGNLNQTLGSKKTFSCNNCKLIIDRDINGARNILIKYLQKCCGA